MNKYYRVEESDFEALPFGSEMDDGLEVHSLIIEEQCKEDFIAEQVANFTRHLLSIIHEVPTRGEHNPFYHISKNYERKHSQFYGNYIVCPVCGRELDEDEWNSITDDTRPCCPTCEYEFEMEELEN